MYKTKGVFNEGFDRKQMLMHPWTGKSFWEKMANEYSGRCSDLHSSTLAVTVQTFLKGKESANSVKIRPENHTHMGTLISESDALSERTGTGETILWQDRDQDG